MSLAERTSVGSLASGHSSAQFSFCLNRPTCVAILIGTDLLLLLIAERAIGLIGPVHSLKQIALLAVPIVVVCSLAQQGCYTMVDRPSWRAVVIALINALGLLSLAVCVVLAFGPGEPPIDVSASSGTMVLVFVATTAGLLFTRSTIWTWARPHVLTLLPDKAAVIIGAARPELIRRLRREFGLGSVVAAGTDENDFHATMMMARRGSIDMACVIVSQDNAQTLGRTLACLSSLPVPVKLIFDTGYGAVLSRDLTARSGLSVFSISDPPLTDSAHAIKRLEDIVLGALLLALLSPLMAIAAISIKLDSRGPVLFRQHRYGHNNTVIKVLKFRTMYHHLEDRDASRQTSRRDPRVTRVGAFLRRHSLDELPQLLNVLGGSMSLIGPRPHALGTTVGGHGLESVVGNYYARHQFKPGITGWAQVSGWRGNLDSVEKVIQRVEHDLYYIENWSVFFDLWIIMKTLTVVLWDREAF